MSSKLTASDIISRGDYLSSNFEPASLTVSQLLGVLSYHNVKYPTPYSKPKLVQAFKDEIAANATKLQMQKLKHESSFPSDDGITDGVTGKPLSNPPPPVRRSSRRLSRAPTAEPEPAPEPLPLPKRRRSSAQPSLGGSSSKPTFTQPQPIVEEESETEDKDEQPARKVGKTRKTSAGPSSKRISLPEDSGWEDNNIFQSGAESSSPIRPARRSMSVRKSRKSASAPPQASPLSSPSRHEGLPQLSKFEPSLPPLPKMKEPTPAPDPQEAEEFEFELKQEDEDVLVQYEELGEGDIEEEEEEDDALVKEEDFGIEPIVPDGYSPLVRITTWLVVLGGLFFAGSFKMESSAIGYCDAGSNTNEVLEQLRSSRRAIEQCNRENRTTLHEDSDIPCPLPTIIPFVHPDACTACPEHATCSQDTVVCETGYILKPHPLFFFLPPVASPTNVTLSSTSPPNELAWKMIAESTNGLPGLGSVAFPPSCVPDPKRKQRIGHLGKAVEKVLAQHRGKILCAGNASSIDDEGKRWGMSLDDLRGAMRSMTAAHVLPTFDGLFDEAMQELIQWGGIIVTKDSSGTRYVAHRTPALTFGCSIAVKSREAWHTWRLTLLSLTLASTCIAVLRARNTRNSDEMKRVNELVPVALRAVRDAEIAHHVDPVTSPLASVSSVQLRDLLLPHETLAVRDRVWNKVARVVEGNTNVRTNLEEGSGGNEMRVWHWVGGK